MYQKTLEELTKSATMRADFENFLRQKGFRENGITEIEKRISEGRPDREDLSAVKDFHENREDR